MTFGHLQMCKIIFFFYNQSNINPLGTTNGYFSARELLVKYQVLLSSFEKPSTQEIVLSPFPVSTVGNPAFRPSIYLTGVHFRGGLQHGGDVSQQKSSVD